MATQVSAKALPGCYPHSLPSFPHPAADALLERHSDTQRFLQMLETLDQPPADAAPDRLAAAGLFLWEVRCRPVLLEELCMGRTHATVGLVEACWLLRCTDWSYCTDWRYSWADVAALAGWLACSRMRCLWRGRRGGWM